MWLEHVCNQAAAYVAAGGINFGSYGNLSEYKLH